jgi:hypothetical protein
VVRLYELHDEAYYVVRRADGRALAVPRWMTCSEAAYAKMVSAARLPVGVLLELRRVTVTCLCSGVHDVPEEDHDATAASKAPTTTVRSNSRPFPPHDSPWRCKNSYARRWCSGCRRWSR